MTCYLRTLDSYGMILTKNSMSYFGGMSAVQKHVSMQYLDR